MIIQDHEAELAYTYAWWLTGDEARARAAVLAAVARPEVPGADDALRVENLLRRVRAAAIEQPTMCPASELALLHDGMGLALDSAAGLAMIDSREARTELAHGRLEALGAQDQVNVVEPERLGGLAVGNPADVAAARQNPALGELRRLILQGRDELVSVSRVVVPDEVLDVVRRAREDAGADGMRPPVDLSPAPDPIETEADTSADTDEVPHRDERSDEGDPFESIPVVLADVESPPAVDTEPSTPMDHEDAEEVDLSSQVGDVEMPLGAPRTSSSLVWVIVGIAFIAAVGFLLFSRGEDALPGGDGDEPTLEVPSVEDGTTPESDPSEPDVGTPEPTGTDADAPESTPSPADSDVPAPTTEASSTEASPTEDSSSEAPATEPDAPATDGVALVETGVAVGLGADPDPEVAAPQATPFDPISFVVTYTGAAEGDALIANWTVDGVPFGTEQVDLVAGDHTSRFSRQVPLEGGWPVGEHVLQFTRAGQADVLGEVRFVVVDDQA